MKVSAMPVTSQKLLIAAIGLAVLCGIVWRALPTRRQATALEKSANDLMQLSLPDKGVVVQPMAVTRETWKTTATWEINTELEWKAYSSWLSKNLGSEFRQTANEQDALEFRKTLPSEILILRAESEPMSQAHRIRISLVVMPW